MHVYTEYLTQQVKNMQLLQQAKEPYLKWFTKYKIGKNNFWYLIRQQYKKSLKSVTRKHTKNYANTQRLKYISELLIIVEIKTFLESNENTTARIFKKRKMQC